jgi:hypothetical protein
MSWCPVSFVVTFRDLGQSVTVGMAQTIEPTALGRHNEGFHDVQRQSGSMFRSRSAARKRQSHAPHR